MEIERTTRKKPYLGGYRHKKTSIEYHHASAQTMQKPRPPILIDRYCRDTQTVEQRHRVQQTTNETSTQMTKIGVFVSNSGDKLIQPQRYTTADEHHDMMLTKVKWAVSSGKSLRACAKCADLHRPAHAQSIIQGPVVQSIVSLTSLLVVKMLTDLVSKISDSQVFFTEKM